MQQVAVHYPMRFLSLHSDAAWSDNVEGSTYRLAIAWKLKGRQWISVTVGLHSFQIEIVGGNCAWL